MTILLPVSLIESTNHSFLLKTGAYRVEYGMEKGPAGRVIIYKDDQPAYSIATPLAAGFDLDPLDPAILQKLDLEDLADRITLTIHSRRDWADFTARLTAFKQYPGLLNWSVEAGVTAPKVFDRLGWETPDCELQVNRKRQAHPMTRYFVPRGPASGMLFFHDHALHSTALYFEDFTSLNPLYELSGYANPFQVEADFFPNSSMVRMGQPPVEFQWAEKDGIPQPAVPWLARIDPYEEFGYIRPSGIHFEPGQQVILGDTYLYLSPEYTPEPEAFSHLFTELLARVYQFIRKPALPATDWAGEAAPAMIHDFLKEPASWGEVNGKPLPRAYVRAANRPGASVELITLVELLVPLERYTRLFPEQAEACLLKERLEAGLPEFWDEQWGGFCNSPRVMPETSGWYLFWGALNVAELARDGLPAAQWMIKRFRDRLIDLGRRCDYTFAILNTQTYAQRHIYNFETSGVYACVMLDLYELSDRQDSECLAEAKRAVEKIRLRGFDYTYELNGVVPGALACARLFKETGESGYLELAYIPLANALRWAVLWNCGYGAGRHSQSFWGFCPTPGNLNLAEHESNNTRRFLRQFYQLAREHLSPEVAAMLRDSWIYGPGQSRFALPPYLAAAGGAWTIVKEGPDQTACGEIDYTSFVPLEDVHVGWCTDDQWYKPNPKNGVVGQEIYGAGGPIWYAIWQKEGDI